MSCEDYQILLNRDLDGVLSADDGKRLAAHVAGCRPCGARQASLQAIHGAFRDLRHADVRPGLADEIVERATAPRAAVLRISPHWLVPAAAAVLALCLVSGALGWRLNEPPNIQAHERLDEAAFRSLLSDQLALPEDRIETILKVRHDFDRRLKSEQEAFKERNEKLYRQEIEELWKLLPADARERYRKHDPTFTPPESPR
jgi:hypothetical protein